MHAFVAVSVFSVFVAVLTLTASAQSTGKPCSSCTKRNITDDVRACRKENPTGCQHVYLFRVIGGPANKVSCKYSLGGGQIYEMGALPRQLTEAEKQAVEKYHEEQKTRKCGIGKCPSMPCLCEDCPNRPKDVVDVGNSTDTTDSTSDGFSAEPVFNATDVTPTEPPFNATIDEVSSDATKATLSTDEPSSDGPNGTASDSTLEPGFGSTDDATSEGPSTGSFLNSTDATPTELTLETTANDSSTDSSGATFSTDLPSSDGPKGASSEPTIKPTIGSTDGPTIKPTGSANPASTAGSSVRPPSPTNNPIISVATGPNGTVSVDVATGNADKDGGKKQQKDGWWSKLKKTVGQAFHG